LPALTDNFCNEVADVNLYLRKFFQT